jgi:transketolase
MRQAFVSTLCSLARQNPKIMLLTADLGYGVLEPFIEAFPDRYINVGCAEQNMIGVATGLAIEGFIPYCYSIATFATMRCFEQFRNGPALHNLPVRLIGVGGGYSYGHAGPTHHGLEDLDIMATLPNVDVFAPAWDYQVKQVIRESVNSLNPVYIRIDKNNGDMFFNTLNQDMGVYGHVISHLGYLKCDVLLVSTGSISHEVLKAVRVLHSEAIKTTFMIHSCLKSSSIRIDKNAIVLYKNVVVIEEGSSALYNLMASTISENRLEGCPSRLIRAGHKPTSSFGLSGDQAWHRKQAGLDAASIVALVRELNRGS